MAKPVTNATGADASEGPDGAVVLSDGVITLRGLTEADVPDILVFATDARSRRFVPLPEPYGEGDAHTFVAAAQAGWAQQASAAAAQLTWAIDVDGRYRGSINARIEHGRVAEIGYGIHPQARGRGLCTRAARLVVDYLFDDLDVEVVRWRADRDNLASWRVAWSLGFRLDGTSRGTHVVNSDRRVPLSDECSGTLLAGEPRTPRAPWYEPVVLDGDRVHLREWRQHDAPQAALDSEAERFDPTQPDSETFERWRQDRLLRMSRAEGVFWCIADVDDRPLGAIQLARLDENFTRGTGSLGYWLHPAARGRGVMQEAIDLLVEHAFAPRTDDAGSTGLGLHRIAAGTDAANRASQRTLRRAGFREIGHERAVIAHPDAEASDAYMFDLVAGDDRVSQTVEPALVPELRTERLLLRPWRADDVPRPEHELDRDSLRFMPVGAQPTAGTFAEWFDRRQRQCDLGSHHWCIARAADDEPLGMISVWNSGGDPAARSCELGYWIYAAHRRRGYVSEAVDVIVEHAFADPVDGGLGLNRLHAGTDADNVASHAILRAAGFAQWGHDHEAFLRPDGSLSDGRYFELLNSRH